MNTNKIYNADCAAELKNFDGGSIDLTVSSPPYDNLRTYGGYSFDFETIAKELYRVTKPGGVIVWVVGDAVEKNQETGTSFRQALFFKDLGFLLHDTMIYQKSTSSFPARANSNRYTQLFEYMFVFSKDIPPKTANLICDKPNRWAGWTNWGKKTHRDQDGSLVLEKDMKPVPDFSPRNNIWRYEVGAKRGQKSKLAYAHPATFPEALARDHILSWSNEGDIVLDPFLGSGTTAKMARILNRHYIGIEINEDYYKLALERVKETEYADYSIAVARPDATNLKPQKRNAKSNPEPNLFNS